jgi:hypothetical protein
VGAYAEDGGATGINGDPTNKAAQQAGAVYVFGRTDSGWAQQAYVKPSDLVASPLGEHGYFGISVALDADGNTLAVGAFNENSGSTGINGDQHNNTAPRSGAVYVFVRNGGAWTQEAYIKASNTAAESNFGRSVALSGNGNTLAVSASHEDSAARGINGNQTDASAPQSGAAYVFVRSGSTWAQQAYIKASNTDANDLFGISLSLSGDGDTLAVGAIGEGSAATGVNGDETDNSLPYSGAVYTFSRTGNSWTQQAYLKASNTRANDNFGYSVALSRDETTLAVGAIFESSSAPGVDGDQADSGAHNAGAVYVFFRDPTIWAQQVYVKASNPAPSNYFGYSVALSADGNMMAVTATGESSQSIGVNGDQSSNPNYFPGAGAAYVHIRTSGTWAQHSELKMPATMGLSTAFDTDGETLVVGCGETIASTTGGCVYVY